MISCPICRGKETHKMDCQNQAYVQQEVAQLQAKLDRITAAAQVVVDAHDPQHTGSVEYRLKAALEERNDAGN